MQGFSAVIWPRRARVAVKIATVSARSVLVVDDDVAILETTSMALTDEGYEVALAGDGAQAIANLERQRFDLVLLDLGLPDVAGLDLLRDIRSRWPAVSVVVVTGRSDTATAVKAMRLGATEYLTKPVNAYQLCRVIASH
jgi:DNA-binding response OmpR family regulator